LIGRVTAFNAASKPVSDMAASALDARADQLGFLDSGLASLMARSLSSSSTTYSVLGMVKLSRTSLGFLGLAGFSALGLTTGFAATLDATLATTLGVAWELVLAWQQAFRTTLGAALPLPCGATFGAALAAVLGALTVGLAVTLASFVADGLITA